MRYLKDSVTAGGRQWRIIAQTNSAETFVVEGEQAYAFESVKDAYSFVEFAYRTAADMRNLQPGQNYTITMADGTDKAVMVQQQTPQGVMMTDTQTGETLNVPHVQTGAEPKPAQPGKQMVQPGQPQMNGGAPAATPVSPENVTDRGYALTKSDLPKWAKVFSDECLNCGKVTMHLDEAGRCPECKPHKVRASEFGKTPHNCKHDGRHLNYKNPSDAEKFCPDCGMVYAASSNRKEDLSDEEMAEQVKITNDIVDELIEEEKAEKAKKDKKAKIVRASDILRRAAAPMPGQQAMPSAETSNDTQSGLDQQMNEKPSSDFAEKPSNDTAVGGKRQLTPHEIIEEAENLIRNALVKGVRIGADELQEYMSQQYNNTTNELLQGIAIAWQKVEYEESMEDGSEPKDQFGPKGPIDKSQLAGLVPENGPVQSPKML